MIAWVNEALKDWGRAQFWLMFKGNGFPSRTMLGKLLEEGAVGAATNQYTREFPEVLTGDNLMVANAVKTLPEYPRALVSVHYVLRLPARDKWRQIGIDRQMYYDVLSGAQVKIANAMEASEARLCAQNDHNFLESVKTALK